MAKINNLHAWHESLWVCYWCATRQQTIFCGQPGVLQNWWFFALVNESNDHFSRTLWQKLATCKLDMRASGFAIDVPLHNINNVLWATRSATELVILCIGEWIRWSFFQNSMAKISNLQAGHTSHWVCYWCATGQHKPFFVCKWQRVQTRRSVKRETCQKKNGNFDIS